MHRGRGSGLKRSSRRCCHVKMVQSTHWLNDYRQAHEHVWVITLTSDNSRDIRHWQISSRSEGCKPSSVSSLQSANQSKSWERSCDAARAECEGRVITWAAAVVLMGDSGAPGCLDPASLDLLILLFEEKCVFFSSLLFALCSVYQLLQLQSSTRRARGAIIERKLVFPLWDAVCFADDVRIEGFVPKV